MALSEQGGRIISKHSQGVGIHLNRERPMQPVSSYRTLSSTIPMVMLKDEVTEGAVYIHFSDYAIASEGLKNNNIGLLYKIK